MTHISIRVESPRGCKNVREIVRIRTPEGTVVPLEGKNVRVSYEGEKIFQPAPLTRRKGKSCGSDAAKAATPTILRSKETEISHNDTEKMPLLPAGVSNNNNETTFCEFCHRELDEIESELYIATKLLASKCAELEMYKSKLEDDWIEKYKVEEELNSERERRQEQVQVLEDRIAELEKREGDHSAKSEDFEHMVEESKGEEVDGLIGALAKSQSDCRNLREQIAVANDQAMEAVKEMELWQKKAQQHADQKDTIRKELRSASEIHQGETKEFKFTIDALQNRVNKECSRIKSLKEEIEIFRQQVKGLENELSSSQSKEPLEENRTSMDSRKYDQMMALSHELNLMFCKHISSQDKCTALRQSLAENKKELEEIRGFSESKNVELQDYKMKYQEIQDLMIATKEDNRHLRNKLQKKCGELRDVRRKVIVLETEVKWLREALNIVGCQNKNVASALKKVAREIRK